MGTIKTTNIETITGSGTLTLGQSGETITIPSGVTITNNGTQTGFGGTMTPAFHATLSSNQSLSDNTAATVAFNSETFDTDNAYNNSTYRFIPQVAGKYFIYSNVYIESGANTNMNRGFTYVYKNSTTAFFNFFDPRDNPGRAFTCNASGIIVLNGSTDYVEVKVQMIAQSSGSGLYVGGGTGGDAAFTYFGAYKIIE